MLVPPADVTDENYARALRVLRLLPIDSPQRRPLRVRTAAHAAARLRADPARRTAARVFEDFRDLLATYEPEEIQAASRGEPLFPAEMRPLADEVVRQYSPRGDEAKVWAALRVLLFVDPSNADYRRRDQELRGWIEEARQSLPDPVERLRDLIEVYGDYVAILADPEAGAHLVDRMIELHRLLARLVGGQGAAANLTFEDFQRYNAQLTRTTYDVVRAEARVGRAGECVERLRPLVGSPGIDARLLDLLERELPSDPAERNRRLAQNVFFREDSERNLAITLAFRGWRASPGDARFAALLGRLYGRSPHADLGAALDFFETAVELQPDARDVYEGALETLNDGMRALQREEDLDQARRVFLQADRMITE